MMITYVSMSLAYVGLPPSHLSMHPIPCPLVVEGPQLQSHLLDDREHPPTPYYPPHLAHPLDHV